MIERYHHSPHKSYTLYCFDNHVRMMSLLGRENEHEHTKVENDYDDDDDNGDTNDPNDFRQPLMHSNESVPIGDSSRRRSGASNESGLIPKHATLLYNQKRNCCTSSSPSPSPSSSPVKNKQEVVNAQDSSQNKGRFKPIDYYDEKLFGLNEKVDEQVEQHKLDTMVYNQDRELKDQQAKLVAPGIKQSPVALMTINPTYQQSYKPLQLDYLNSVEHLRLANTGYFWDVKIPYQISMTTALHGAQFSSTTRYRLDQIHCHWGADDSRGSEHTVDSRYYAAEMHLVHYNMDKYRTLAQAARHPDGLVVLAVFLETRASNLNHPELEKIAANLANIPLRGDHTIINQAVRIENLLPQNRSFWSYQGSLTTSPFYESVTWFVMKHPIQCSSNQLQRFRQMRSSHHIDDDSNIVNNIREVQPLHGRTVLNYDDQSSYNH